MPREDTQWKPGQSGNPLGRPRKDETWSRILRKIGEQTAPGDKVSYKEKVGQILWEKASKGNVKAIKELFNRMEGMPKQFIEAIMSAREISTEELTEWYERHNLDQPGGVIKGIPAPQDSQE